MVAQIDYDAWRFWLVIGQIASNVLIAGYLWISRKNRATNEKVDRVEEYLGERISDAEKSIVQIEANLKHMPSQKELDELGRDIRDLTSELGEVKGRLEGVKRVADLMNEFLINQGSNKS